MLFGHQNDDASQSAAVAVTPITETNVNPLAVDPATGASLPTVTEPAVEPATTSILNQPASTAPVTPMVEPEEPVASTTPFTAPPVEETPSVIEAPVVTPSFEGTDSAPAPEIEATSPVVSDTLLALKQQALAELSPLVDKLDQSPEERFRTTMMMIQSTDNQALIQNAYDAAQAISDEKVRAQALLDVINEINYFTQQSSASN